MRRPTCLSTRTVVSQALATCRIERSHCLAGQQLHDLLLVQHAVPLFKADDLNRVVGKLIALIQAGGASLRIPSSSAGLFASVAVAAAWTYLQDPKAFSDHFYVASSDLTTGTLPVSYIVLPGVTTPAPATSSGCPPPGGPDLICQSLYCKGDTDKSSCGPGTYESCRCTAEATIGTINRG